MPTHRLSPNLHHHGKRVPQQRILARVSRQHRRHVRGRIAAALKPALGFEQDVATLPVRQRVGAIALQSTAHG